MSDDLDDTYEDGYESGYEAGKYETAEELASLRSQLKEAREIMQPFADIAKACDDDESGGGIDDDYDLLSWDFATLRLPMVHFRRARAFLISNGGGDE